MARGTLLAAGKPVPERSAGLRQDPASPLRRSLVDAPLRTRSHLLRDAGMSFVLHYNTAITEVSMPFETVEEALEYLAHAIPRKIKEEYSNQVSGLSIPSPRIIE